MGKIEIDHTGTGSGITLSSDGTDLLLNGTAIGGGGAALELYAENPSSPTAPSATGTNAVAIGSESVSTATRSIALGRSYASGTDSFAASIDAPISTYGASSTDAVAIGKSNRASGTGSLAMGGSSLAFTTSTIAIGHGCESRHFYAIVVGRAGLSRGEGTFTHGSFGESGAVGEAQATQSILCAKTSDATPTLMGLGSTAGSKFVLLPNNSAYAFHGTIVARQQASAGTASAAWKIEGLIRREGSAGTTVLVNSATTVIDNTPGWGLALSADTTNGGLKIEFTGAAATNIRVVATVHTSEVTY